MSSDQQYLTTLRETRQRMAADGIRSVQEQMRSLGFASLRELTDEIERIEDRLLASGQSVDGTGGGGGRRIMQPIRRING